MRHWETIDISRRIKEIHEARLHLRRIYNRKKGNFSKDERTDLINRLQKVNEKCAAIVDHFRNEVFPGIRLDRRLKQELMGKPEVDLWKQAEHQMNLIRWLEDRYDEQCKKHLWRPELVTTNSGKDKWILVCEHCGKEFKKLSKELKQKYNLE